MVYMIESQVAYVLDALRTMERAGAATAEVREEAEAAWNRELDGKLAGTVWNSGCSSWYADSTGRIAALWPDWTFAFRRRLRAFDADSYELRVARPAGDPVVV
jgi:cyclohexanone monooxygenase